MVALALLACTRGELRRAELCEIPPLPMGPLHTEGTDLVDEDGRVVLLRGINAGGRSKFAPYHPYPDSDLDTYLDRAEGWGFDVLRVPFSWAAMETAPGVWDEERMARYDALLDGAAERNMWTIVDFHQDVYAEAFCGDGFPHWTLPEDPGEAHHDCEAWFTQYSGENEVTEAFALFWADTWGAQTAFKDMWSVMATRHAGRTGVLGFELMNEPHGDALAVSALFEELTQEVQAIDADALVFIDTKGTDGIQGTTSIVPPAAPNVVFAPHFYTPGALFGGDLGEVEPVLDKWAALGIALDVPVLLGEFGVQADNGGDIEQYAHDHYEAFDRHGMHATWWEYSDATELWNFEDLSVWNDGPREDMLAGLVRPYVRRIEGEGSWSVTDGELTATLGPGTHELASPRGNVVYSSGGCVDTDWPLVRVQTDETITLEVRIESLRR